MQPFGCREEVRNIARVGIFRKTHMARLGIWHSLEGGSSLEKKGRGNVERSRDLLQPACADPVGPFLIFLDLLKRQPQRIAELFLAHAKHDTPHADTAANVPVDRVRYFFHKFPKLISAATLRCGVQGPGSRNFCLPPSSCWQLYGDDLLIAQIRLPSYRPVRSFSRSIFRGWPIPDQAETRRQSPYAEAIATGIQAKKIYQWRKKPPIHACSRGGLSEVLPITLRWLPRNSRNRSSVRASNIASTAMTSLPSITRGKPSGIGRK